jgi:hypothetical protein
VDDAYVMARLRNLEDRLTEMLEEMPPAAEGGPPAAGGAYLAGRNAGLLEARNRIRLVRQDFARVRLG